MFLTNLAFPTFPFFLKLIIFNPLILGILLWANKVQWKLWLFQKEIKTSIDDPPKTYDHKLNYRRFKTKVKCKKNFLSKTLTIAG